MELRSLRYFLTTAAEGNITRAADVLHVTQPTLSRQLMDLEKELERLSKEQQRLRKEIARSNGMLNNEKFVSKAPAAKVQEERDKLENYANMLKQVEERLAQLRK